MKLYLVPTFHYICTQCAIISQSVRSKCITFDNRLLSIVFSSLIMFSIIWSLVFDLHIEHFPRKKCTYPENIRFIIIAYPFVIFIFIRVLLGQIGPLRGKDDGQVAGASRRCGRARGDSTGRVARALARFLSFPRYW